MVIKLSMAAGGKKGGRQGRRKGGRKGEGGERKAGEERGWRKGGKKRGMKLDANVLRYLTKEEFRVLTAVEQGQRNVSADGESSLSRDEDVGERVEKIEKILS